MGGVHVANFKTRSLARQTARPESRNTPLVSNLRQRIVLIHKLRELTGTEELFYRSRNWLCIDQVLRHESFAFRHGKTLFHCSLNSHQADSELVLSHLTHRAHATVTEVVNVVDHALTVTDINQRADDINDIVLIERRRPCLVFPAKSPIELHATHGRQIVSLWREEQILEQVLRGFFCGRLTGAHHAINFNQRL